MKIKLISEVNPNLTVVEQILVNRGLTLEEIPRFLNTTDADVLPYIGLENIQYAVEVFLKHYRSQSRILIQVDCDADGYTSAAALYNYLVSNFEGVQIDVQVHDDKTHGLTITDEVKKGDYKLIFVPDAGSNEYETHAALKAMGVDIIILDHHEAEKESLDAIVVNNQLSENYSNKTLCGAGVVYQFLRALKDGSKDYSKEVMQPDDVLDLVALGLIADMSDLKNLETKRLIEKGLEAINQKKSTNNPFLSYLVAKNSFSLGSSVSPMGLAFYIAPMINSVVRVGDPKERLLAFEAMLIDKGNMIVDSTKRGAKGEKETLIEQAARTLTNVRNRQKKIRDTAFETLDAQITQESLNNNAVIFVDAKGILDKNLNGLVANQIMAKYRRPVFVMSADKEGVFRGSGRNYECEIMQDFRAFVEQSEFAAYATGHGNAFGASFTKENLQRFMDYANENLNYENLEPEYLVDFAFELSELTPEKITEIASIKNYWGKGMDEPLIAIKMAKVNAGDKVLMSPDKNPTLKINIKGIPCIKFRTNRVEFDSIAPNAYTSTLINAVGKCVLNEWQGNVNPQILFEDYEVLGPVMNF